MTALAFLRRASLSGGMSVYEAASLKNVSTISKNDVYLEKLWVGNLVSVRRELSFKNLDIILLFFFKILQKFFSN